MYSFHLEYILTANSAVRIQIDTNSLTCEIPCNDVTLYCNGNGQEVEWVNPSHYVINFTKTDRIYSKEQFCNFKPIVTLRT